MVAVTPSTFNETFHQAAARMFNVFAQGATSAGPFTDGLSHIILTDIRTQENAQIKLNGDVPEWLTVPRSSNVPWCDDEEAWEAFDLRYACQTLWEELAEVAYTTTHPHLHPDSKWEYDPFGFADGYGAFYVGMSRRETPTVPPEFDPALSPQSHEMGVIAFPIHAPNAINYLVEDNMTHRGAAELHIRLVFVSAYLHETFEMWQDVPGQPVFDPHHDNFPFTVTLHLQDGRSLEANI